MSDPALASDLTAAPSARVHQLAALCVCLVWPLIWVGGLVTTYDAGMAVPDWPGTYGYNLFLYPPSTWLSGPFDLFIEHGHRLLAAIVGFVSIGLAIFAYRSEPRRWVARLAALVLVAVIGQGVLGGLRVVLSDRTLAMIHGCTGPAFFVLCVITAAVTGRWWLTSAQRSVDVRRRPSRGQIGWVGLMFALSYTQLVLGAQLRHVQPDTRASMFAMTIAFHVLTAFILWIATAVGWAWIRRCGDLTLSRPAGWLIFFVLVQITLGIGTWAVNYGFPDFLNWFPGSEALLLRSKGFVDSIIVTSHVATGSLILAICGLLLVRLLRIRFLMQVPSEVSPA
ncbi:MAG: COX15/CtaA family protein [Planctomycetota bacterium]